MECTRKIAEFVVGTNYGALPAGALETAKTALIDCVGVALAGSKEVSAKICSRMVQQESARGESTVFGQGFKSSPVMAAFANGTAAHALDYDHSFYLMGQPTSGLIPAILTLGESIGANGRDVLEAYVLGFEVTAKLAASMPDHSNKGGWHSPGTLGSLGATVSCSKLLRLDAGKIQMALGIVSSMASGIIGNFGTMTKPLHAGLAARNGVLAAQLAQAGYTANPEALETGMGFFEIYCRNLPVVPAALGTLGASYALIEKGIKIKPYPCGGLTHAAIDAVLEIRAQEGLTPEMIESIKVDVTRHTYNRIAFRIPSTGLQGKFSMPYVLARAMTDGKVSLDTFTDDAVREHRILELAAKVHMTVDPGLRESGAGSRPCRVAIRLNNGTSFSRDVDHPRGSPEILLSPAELRAKFVECATRAISKETANRVLGYLHRLETVTDIRPLCEILSAKGE
ncbi:MAG: MmgE/PrpD family protein [Candidatus Binatia bacterium]